MAFQVFCLKKRIHVIFTLLSCLHLSNELSVQVTPKCKENWTDDDIPFSGSIILALDCSYMRLSEIPLDLDSQATILNLSHNNISHLLHEWLSGLRELKVLDLSYNKLSTLLPGSFSSLSSLKKLDLMNNNLCMNEQAMPPGIFQNLNRLEHLSLTHQNCHVGHANYPDEAISDLSNLKYVSLTGISGKALGQGFGRLSKLSELEFVGNACNMRNVPSDMFEVLREINIKSLYIHDCALDTSVPFDIFHPLQSLETLSLACNDKLSVSYSFDLVNNIESPNLKTVILDNVNGKVNIEFLTLDHVCTSTITQLEKLSLNGNNILYSDPMIRPCLMKIPFFAFAHNPFKGEVYFEKTYQENANKIQQKIGTTLGIKSIDLSFANMDASYFREKNCPCKSGKHYAQGVFRDPPDYLQIPPDLPQNTFNVSNEINFQMNIAQSVPASLLYVYYDHVSWHLGDTSVITEFREGNNILYVNISFSPLPVIERILGLTNVQVVDARNCNIRDVKLDVCSQLKSLRYLFIQNNALGTGHQNFSACFHTFSNLKHLDISFNKITSLDQKDLLALKSLQFFNIAGNKLVHVDIPVVELVDLTFIDLSFNAIYFLRSKFIDQLVTAGASRKLTFDLSRNPFLCDCERLAWLKWFKDSDQYNIKFINDQIYQCSNNDNPLLLALNIEAINMTCLNPVHKNNTTTEEIHPNLNISLICSIATCTGATLICVLVGLYFTHHLKILCWFYAISSKLPKFRRRMKYHVTLLFDYSDVTCIEWIEDHFRDMLENKMGLTVYIFKKDFDPGSNIANQIVNSIKHGRKVFVLISDGKSKEEWFEYAVQVALSLRSPRDLILCQLNPSSMDHKSIPIQNLQSLGDIEVFPTDPQSRVRFWNRIKQRILGNWY